MKKRYIIALDSSTEGQNNAFRRFIKDSNFSWWHWIENFWLLIDSAGEYNSEKIRDKVDELFPGVYNLVIELNEDYDTWQGFGPAGGGEEKEKGNMFTWLRDNWKK
jgi:hypothetical protein